MNRFRRLNPDDYGGVPSLLLHLHNKRRESTEPPESIVAAGKSSTVSTRLAEVGKPLAKCGEVKEIQVAVEEFVSDLLKIIGKLKGCFISTMIPCGSFYEETKVTAPNEFDFMAEIQVLSFRGACSILWNNILPGTPMIKLHPFLAVTLFNELFDDPFSSGFSLGALKFRKSFKETLLMALDVMYIPPCWKSVGIGKKDKGPSILLGLTWNGYEYDNLEITIDITPAIKFHHWPHWTDISAFAPASFGESLEAVEESCHVVKKFPLYGRNAVMYEMLKARDDSEYPPSGPAVDYVLQEGETPSLQAPILPLPLEKITKLGFHVVPVSPVWRASFSVAELLIIKKFSPDSNRLICYRSAKYFRDQHLGDNAVLSSYLLKTTFFFELEKFPEDKFWSKCQMFARLYNMIFRLLRESKEHMVCSYFISDCYIAHKQVEDILPYAVQRVLDDVLFLTSHITESHCCHISDDDVDDDNVDGDESDDDGDNVGNS